MQKGFNNSNYLLILPYIAMLLRLLLPPLQLHETETFLDVKQNTFNTRNWILIRLLEGLKAWALG